MLLYLTIFSLAHLSSRCSLERASCDRDGFTTCIKTCLPPRCHYTVSVSVVYLQHVRVVHMSGQSGSFRVSSELWAHRPPLNHDGSTCHCSLRTAWDWTHLQPIKTSEGWREAVTPLHQTHTHTHTHTHTWDVIVCQNPSWLTSCVISWWHKGKFRINISFLRSWSSLLLLNLCYNKYWSLKVTVSKEQIWLFYHPSAVWMCCWAQLLLHCCEAFKGTSHCF